MFIYKVKDYNALSKKTAKIIASQIILNTYSVLGLATGSSPIGAYKYLIDWHKNDDLDFSNISSINLDEYVGLSSTHNQSYRYFMNNNLFNHINIDINNTYVPNGLEKNVDYECKRYNDIIKKVGGIDLQLLGIGENSHIGFNEPDDSFAKQTHLVDLTQDTIKANSRFFDDDSSVPRQAYSLGIKNIMSAKKILLIASGRNKANAIYNSFFGPITPRVPASILQFHKDITVIADEDALSLVSIKGLI